MIKIKITLHKNQLKDFINLVYRTCRSEPNLSPRSKSELMEAYNKKRFLIAMDGEKPAGWLILIPYTNNVQEVAAGFVLETYRSRGIFSKLVHKALNYSPISILVTFNKSLDRNLSSQMGFRSSSFWEMMKLSRGRFLLKRLNLNRVKAIRTHYDNCKPMYLLFEK